MLMAAEGLLMFLTEADVRALLSRLTDGFNSGGEMAFDTLSPLGPRVSKLLQGGIVKWGIRDAGQMQRWNPRLRLVEQTSTIASPGYEKIPATGIRLLYRALSATPVRNYNVLNRFAF
jgi:O-methyltransferase involved in polyketide biosynthesis